MQESHNSIANTLELCLSCTKPSNWSPKISFLNTIHFQSTNASLASCSSMVWLKLGQHAYIIISMVHVKHKTSSMFWFRWQFNLLGPSDTIWCWKSWSTLVQVMACCLTAPSHYLNSCWLIISKVLWHSSDDIIIRRFEDTNQSSYIEYYIFKITTRWVDGTPTTEVTPVTIW